MSAVTHANMTTEARDPVKKTQSGLQENISANVLGNSEYNPTPSSSGDHNSGNNGSYSEGKNKLEPEMRETLKIEEHEAHQTAQWSNSRKSNLVHFQTKSSSRI